MQGRYLPAPSDATSRKSRSKLSAARGCLKQPGQGGALDPALPLGPGQLGRDKERPPGVRTNGSVPAGTVPVYGLRRTPWKIADGAFQLAARETKRGQHSRPAFISHCFLSPGR